MPPLPKVARVTTYTKEFTAVLQKEFERRTKRAAEVVRDQLRLNLSQPGGGQPSKPGEFPRMQKGALVRGVYTKLSSSSPYTFRILNRAKHNAAQEYGTTGGKIIVPKKAAALRFMAGGKVVFSKRVRQGAISARAQARRTLQEMRPVIRAIYTRGISGMMKGNKLTLRIG